MLIELIVLSLIIGLIRGGTFNNFKYINFKKIWPLILALVIQYFLVSINLLEEFNFYEKIAMYLKQLLFISYVLLFVGIIINLHYRSLWPVLAGAFLNFFVLAVNNWKRPVLLEGLKLLHFEDALWMMENNQLPLFSAITEGTKYPILADIIVVPKPYPFPTMLSLGDLLIGLGLFTLIQEIMLSGRNDHHIKYNYLGRY